MTPLGEVTSVLHLALNFPVLGIVPDNLGNVYVGGTQSCSIHSCEGGGDYMLRLSPADEGAPSRGLFVIPLNGLFVTSLASDHSGGFYATVRDIHGPRNAIYRITLDGNASLIAGNPDSGPAIDGVGTAARFNGPRSVATDRTGNIYVFDTGNRAVRKITSAGVVSTVATLPSPGPTPCSVLGELTQGGIAISPDGIVYVADLLLHTVWRVTPQGMVTPILAAEDFRPFASESKTCPTAVAALGSDLYITLEAVVLVLHNRP